MLKPPINDLVNKISEELGTDLGSELGNRYSLVLAMAKRAREIAINEDKEKDKEPTGFESRMSDKYKNTKEVVKPIHKAIDEFTEKKIEVYHMTPEEIAAANASEVVEEVKPVYEEVIDFSIDDDEEGTEE